MLRIIVNGYFGRMGQVIANTIRAQADLKLVAGIDVKSADSVDCPVFPSLEACTVDADVVIDFSHPDSLFTLLPQAAAKKLAVVIATTGLGEKQQELIRSYAKDVPIFYSANMSLGINLVKDLIKKAASVLGRGYDIEIVEMHHRLKKDAPSGTALLLLNGLNEVIEPQLEPIYGRDSKDRLRTQNEVGIHSLRGGTIVGDHHVVFAGTDEVVKVSHVAYSRQIFASGALKAARYLFNKTPGIYTMDKMINENNIVTNLYAADDEVLMIIGNIPFKMSVITSLYGALSKEEINIDMISQTQQSDEVSTVSFSLFMKDLTKAVTVIGDFIRLYPTVSYQIDSDISKITVEGPGMEQQSGVTYKVFSCLEKQGIAVKVVTTSETKISTIIKRRDKEKAITLLKDAFGI
ncbi:MAG: 4-hydroxy-tetrahydrodipicolinate reductase [Treponemataceae bacterium]